MNFSNFVPVAGLFAPVVAAVGAVEMVRSLICDDSRLKAYD
jgi:hypothetical protein